MAGQAGPSLAQAAVVCLDRFGRAQNAAAPRQQRPARTMPRQPKGKQAVAESVANTSARVAYSTCVVQRSAVQSRAVSPKRGEATESGCTESGARCPERRSKRDC